MSSRNSASISAAPFVLRGPEWTTGSRLRQCSWPSTASAVAQAPGGEAGSVGWADRVAASDRASPSCAGDRAARAGSRRPGPIRPNAVAMLVDILKGSQLGPGDGWFKKAVAQTRYRLEGDAQAARSRRRRADQPGRVWRRTTPTSPGSTATTTARSTERDFDFSAHALTPSPGAMLFYRPIATATAR